MSEYTYISRKHLRNSRSWGGECWFVPLLATAPPSLLGARTNEQTAVNYRLKAEDIGYILNHAEAEVVLVDHEFVGLLDDSFRKRYPNVPLIVDTDTDATEGELSGPFDEAVLEGLQYDRETGDKGWDRLEAQCEDEEGMLALAYTSGTTAKPKGVEYTHRSAYLAALGNVIESGLGYHSGRCHYLWTLPMFHAMVCMHWSK